MSYKPIPDGAIELVLQPSGCGDDCCCSWFEIRAVLPSDHPKAPYWIHKDTWSWILWESSWYWPGEFPDNTNYDELRAEITAACNHYGIPVTLGDDRWDWEASIKLKKAI